MRRLGKKFGIQESRDRTMTMIQSETVADTTADVAPESGESTASPSALFQEHETWENEIAALESKLETARKSKEDVVRRLQKVIKSKSFKVAGRVYTFWRAKGGSMYLRSPEAKDVPELG